MCLWREDNFLTEIFFYEYSCECYIHTNLWNEKTKKTQ